MIEKGFGTQHAAMTTKNVYFRLLLMVKHKCAKFYLILTISNALNYMGFKCKNLNKCKSYL